jgi:hypothetical protein
MRLPNLLFVDRGSLRGAGWSVAVAVALALAFGGCSSSHGGHPTTHPDGGAGHGGSDGGGITMIKKDGGVDAPVSTCGRDGPTIDLGKSCSCDGECLSGNCVEGVCCSSACSNGCQTCSAPESPGTCVMRPAGAAPRTGSTCTVDDPASCGRDGFCDGAGSCRKYLGNTCMHGTCSGDAVVGAFACDGTGQCKPGITLMLCIPYTCDDTTGACFEQCDSAAMCQSGGVCDFSNESCGKAQNGQPCTKDLGCISGHCTDGVCCNSVCNGACTACNLPGRVGTCFPTADGKPDPRGICKDQGQASCGHDGTCDGVGGCANYPRDMLCLASTCTGDRLNTAGTCDGLGTCRPPGVQNCHPFKCASGACTTKCVTNDDCDTGAICQNGTCGPKPLGFTCGSAGECASGFCVDGVCCENACTGTCNSCAIATSPGHCLMVAADNPDLRGVCKDNGAASCGTNGKCDGTGSCERYPTGTVCASEKCESGVSTAQSSCNATGQCVAPDSIPCTPFICNGTQCFRTCATNDQCKPPYTCNNNSCGLKVNGSACSSNDECISTTCAQGFCCNTACDGKCQSCALANSQGACTNVPAGTVDPTATCADQGPTSCGTNGKCDGNAGCQLYAQGTTCLGSSCPVGSTTFTAGSTCNGAGTCVTPNPTPCFPYQCGTNICKNSCTTDGDCASPAVCIGGSCGLKGNGQACASAVECLSGFCAQGYCCGTACQGACQSCGLANSLGTCSNVANGSPDPQGTCHDMGNASCMTDGFCNGNGACRLYAGGTSCAPPSCPASSVTLTSGRTCDGAGTCQPATTIACAPYICNGSTACKAACAVDADCQSPNICDPMTNLCGNKKRLGQPCGSSAECLTGNSCVDGVCCSTGSCPTCQACNVTGSAGKCANVSANTTEPHGQCAAAPPCGNTGACDGAGHCQQGGTGVACGTASCTGSTFTPVSHCTGAGGCATATSSTCPNNFVCGTNNACKTSCTADADCVAPFTCQGSGATKNCALKPNGQACAAGSQCISGYCVDGVCCGSAGCGTCQACNLNGMGSCSAYPSGAAAPSGQCPVTTACGNTGTCNGAGACTQSATTVVCGAATCTGVTYTPAPTCTGTGSCGTASPTTCGQYVCGTGACKTTCAADTDCSSGNYCTGAGGSCVSQKGNGAACAAAHECGSGNCVDGVCCSTASCGTCQVCNLNGLGTCSNVANGLSEPHARCAANGTCGNTGTCNGAGACTQAAATVTCGSPTCTGSTYTPAPTCTGSGTCGTATATTCGQYVCATSTTCKTSCSADTDCASGNYCTGPGGSCVSLKGNGAVCAAAHECGSNNCVDGVCCMTASCGTCQACSLNGLGTCSNVGSGLTEPHARCAANGTCGNTGTCNGAGACTQATTSVMCIAPSCTGGIATGVAYCTGAGGCGTPTTTYCLAFACGATTCNTSCNADTDCATGNYCTGPGGSCKALKALGATCSTGHECNMGSCVDGVCCSTTSCATCQACNLNGAGTCSNLAAGTTCGGAAICAANSTLYTPAATCDGAGTCGTPSATDCTPYLCSATGCPKTCGSDADCISGDYCSGAGGNCLPRQSAGVACTTNDQCSTGHCTDGFCCGAASCGSCASCGVTGKEGACTNLAAGKADPTGTCTAMAQPASSCGHDGMCDGAGGCELWPTSTMCAGPSCPLGTHQVVATYCDGLGGCNMTGLVSECSPLMCDGASACLLGCSANSDCALGLCVAGACL